MTYIIVSLTKRKRYVSTISFLLNIEIFIKLNKLKNLSTKPHRQGRKRRLITTQSIVLDRSKLGQHMGQIVGFSPHPKGNYKQ